MHVIVEVIRDRNTRRAHGMTLLYGPYNTEVPGTDEEWCRKRGAEKATEDMARAGIEGYEIDMVRVLDE